MFSEWQLDWNVLLEHLVLLLVAYVLALPIGWNRERSVRSAGLRTFPLVAVGACAYVLIGLRELASDEARSRIVYGIVTGIGFVGGGAILKEKSGVSGTATAASIWNTGAIGVAVGWGRIEIAVILSVLNLLTLSVGRYVKDRLGHGPLESDE